MSADDSCSSSRFWRLLPSPTRAWTTVSVACSPSLRWSTSSATICSTIRSPAGTRRTRTGDRHQRAARRRGAPCRDRLSRVDRSRDPVRRALLGCRLGIVALAERFGLETILGAFLAGAVLNLIDHDTMAHPKFRPKLEAIGYGLVIPVFFVASGLSFDLHALVRSPGAVLRVPVFLVALLIVRAVPALLYARRCTRRSALAAGFLQATTLPFLVTATDIGVALDVIKPVNAAALVSAGLLSVLLFPPLALSWLRPAHTSG